MEASIIILTKDAGENFKPLLERIFSQRFDGEYEVLVIDSGSTDDTLNTAREFPVKIKLEHNLEAEVRVIVTEEKE